jgi:hypothetical protein
MRPDPAIEPLVANGRLYAWLRDCPGGGPANVRATTRFWIESNTWCPHLSRFVDRFVRPKVLSHVARQRFSPRDAPLSSIGSRRDQFPDVVSTMRALRLPTHASPVTYLFRFRGPRDSSSVRARRCQRSRAGGGPATGQDHCSAGDLKLPAQLHVDASGTSQVPRRPILCLCPVPRPRPDRRSLANNGRIRCCPCCRESKGSSVLIISRLQRGFGTCCLRFKSGVATATCKTRFRLAG